MPYFIKYMLIIGLLSLGLGSCKKQQSFDQQMMLTALVDDYVLPSYEQLIEDNKEMEEACLVFIQQPSLNSLTNLQAAWEKTMATWSTVELLNFGPGRNSYRYLQLDNTPIRGIYIENAIIDTVVIDSVYLASRSSYTKGFAGIEYLIFNANASQQTIVDQYQTSVHKTRRAAYLLNSIKNTKALLEQIYKEWSTNYGTTVRQSTDNSTQGGLSSFSNAIVHMSQTMARKKLGKPLGKESVDQQIHKEYIESPYAHFSWEIILHNLKGIEAIFGDEHKGLGSFLAYQVNDPSLSQETSAKIASIKNLIEARTLSLHDDLTANQAAVEEVHKEMSALYEMLNEYIATYFSITILTNPDDGD